MIGKVEAIEKKPTSTGGTLTKFRVGGTYYGAFTCPELNIGEEIEFDGVQAKNPKFGWNAVNIRKVNGNGGMTVGVAVPAQSYPQAVPAITAKPMFGGNTKTESPDREPRIVRQNAFS